MDTTKIALRGFLQPSCDFTPLPIQPTTAQDTPRFPSRKWYLNPTSQHLFNSTRPYFISRCILRRTLLQRAWLTAKFIGNDCLLRSISCIKPLSLQSHRYGIDQHDQQWMVKPFKKSCRGVEFSPDGKGIFEKKKHALSLYHIILFPWLKGSTVFPKTRQSAYLTQKLERQ